MMLSIEHAKLRINYLKNELARLPRGKVVQFKNHGCVYDAIYISHHPLNPELAGRYFSLNRKQGKQLSIYASYADNIERVISELTSELRGINNKVKTTTENKRRYRSAGNGLEFFKELKKTEDSNPYPKSENSIEYKGILMRSKGEMIIAQHLDNLSYTYSYESTLYLGKAIYPDFSVYIPEIDKVIFIEFMGAMDDPEYLPKAAKRFMLYSQNGYTIGRDVLFICESKNSPADLDLLNAQLNAAIMACTEYV